jgi:predicted PurR-regulated permease PerM
MSGLICLAVLFVLFVMWGWAGVFFGLPLMLMIMVFIARKQLDREDRELIRRAQRGKTD